MKLQEGYYIITRNAPVIDHMHFLRVFKANGIKYYQIDYAMPQQENYYTDQFNLGRVRIVKQIPNGSKIRYENVQVKIEFEIKGAGNFVFKAKNKKMFKRINKCFPRLLSEYR